MRVKVTSTVAVRPASETPAIDAVRRAVRAPGTPLPPELLAELQERFGTDLRDVRLHADTDADRAARGLRARALTIGRDILLARGEGDLQTSKGRRLLLHEVAHASQSRPARGAALRIAPAAEARGHEARAERALAAYARGAAPAAGAVAPGTILPLLQDAVLRPGATGTADPYADVIAHDIATSLSSAAVGAGARAQRRLSRMPEADRTAVLARVQSLLTPEQRERFAGALGRAADLEAQTAPGAAAPAQREQARPLVSTTQARAPEDARDHATPTIEPSAGGAASTSADAAASSATEPGVPEATEPRAPEMSIGAEAAHAPAQPVEAQEQGQTPAGERPQGPALFTPQPAGEDAAPAAAPDYGPIDSAGERALAHVSAGPAASHTSADAAPAEASTEPTEAGIQTLTDPEPSAAVSDSDEQPLQAEPTPAGTDMAPSAAIEPPGALSLPEPAGEADDQLPDAPSGVAAHLVEAPTPTEAPARPEVSAPAEPRLADVEPVAPDVGEPSIGPSPTASEPAATAAGAEDVTSAAEPEATAQSPTEAATPIDAQPTDTQAAAPDAAPSDGAHAEADGGESGGDCGPDSAPGVSGSGGGDSGGAPAEQSQPVVADVSGAEPGAALQQVSDLPPTQMQAALGSVRATSSRSVGAQRQELASNPPTVRTPDPLPPGQLPSVTADGQAHTERVAGAPGANEPVQPSAPQLSPAPQLTVTAPSLPPAATAITDEQARALQASVDAVPVTDPALEIDAGAVPSLSLTGDANPQGARDQHAQLVSQGQSAAAQGAIDVAAPAGEDHLFPQRPSTTLAAPVAGASPAAGAGAGPALSAGAGPASGAGTGPGATAGAGPASSAGATAGAGPAPGASGDRAIDALANERSRPAMSIAARQGVSSIAAGDEQQRATAAAARVDASSDMQRQVAENRDAQATERSRAQTAVGGQRTQWSAAQRSAVDEHQHQADEELTRATDGAPARQATAESQARAKIADGNTEIADKRRTAERDARAKRDGAKQESSGVLGWLADRARGFFNALKEGIHAIFDLARSAINGIIQRIQRAAFAIIDAARNAVIDLIREVGDRLIAIGDELLSAFPGLRDRFRRAIGSLVDAAVSKVNELADGLEEGLRRALAALAGALNAALDLLESVYQAAIGAVANVVNGAIESARAVLRTLAQWGALIADIASNPGQWIRKLGAAALDGLRNHLWRELKCAVKAWFQSKVEEVLGLPLTIFGMLRRGGLKLAQIGRMVWEGLVSAIPGILINLAIEKIVAMLIPATGAIAAIIEFLRAAWPTLSRVFAAFERFFAFLQAVKSGDAARKFAQMIAAGVVVVLDFLANFLVRRLKRPAQPIGGRLRALAERIMIRIRAALGAVARTARRVAAAVGRGARAAARGIRRAATATAAAVRRVGGRALRALGRAGGRVMRSIERRLPRLARVVRSVQHTAQRVVDRGRAFVNHQRDRYRAWRERRRKRRQQSAGDRLARAQRELPARVRSLLARGVSGARLWLMLRFWKAQYRLSDLSYRREGESHISIHAFVNPQAPVASAYMPTGPALVAIIHQAVRELMTTTDVHVASLAQQANMGVDRAQPLGIQGAGFLSQVVSFRRDRVGLGRLRQVLGKARLNVSVQRFYTLVRGAPPIREWQRWLSSRNAFVAIPGARGGSYVDLAQDLSAVRAAGHSDREIARGMRGIVQTGTIDPKLSPHAPLLSGMTSLMLGRESVRNQTNVAMGAMTLDLIEKGNMTFDQAFTEHEPGGKRPALGGRGEFPMSMVGAQRAADRDVHERADARLVAAGGQSALGNTSSDARAATNAGELGRREQALATRWVGVYQAEIQAMIAAEGGEAFADEAEGRRRIDEQVKRFIRGRIAAFYGIRESWAHGGPP